MANGVISFFRFLGVFTWLRWRLLVNFVRSATRRDALGCLGRWADVATRLALVAFAVPLVLALAAGAVALGWAVGARDAGQTTATLTRILLIPYVLGILISPVAFGGRPALPSTARFLLLPIPRRRLHAARFLSGLADPWLVVGAIPLLLFPLGLVLGGEPWTALVALLAGALLVLLLAALASWLSLLTLLLLRHRRRRDTFALAFFLVMIAGSFAVALLDDDAAGEVNVETIFYVNPPGELYAQAVFGAGSGILPLAGLVAAALGLYVLSARAHDRLLRNPEASAGSVSRARSGGELRLPGLSPAASAVAAAQARALWRTVPGKIAVLQGLIVVLMSGAVTLRFPVEEWPITDLVSPDLLLLFAAMLLIYFGQIQLLFNQFAVDRAGLTLNFLLPLATRDLLYGKAAALALLAFGALALAAGPALWLTASSWSGAASSLLFVTLALASAHLLIMPLAALVSALFPKAVDLGRAFGKNQPHQLAVLVGMASTSFACAMPAALALVGLGVAGSRLVALALLLGWLAFTGLLARVLMPPVAAAVWRRRGDGPPGRPGAMTATGARAAGSRSAAPAPGRPRAHSPPGR